MGTRLAVLVAFVLFCLAAPLAGAAGPIPPPSCAEGPVTVGATTYGTPCDDTIVVPATVERVDGGAGDDRILAGPIAAALPCAAVCLGVGSQTFEGGPGNDVVFRFGSSERDSRFRCKLDRKPYWPCASPRAYVVGLGRHTVRVFAIDAAGNADASPAWFRFRLRRR